jgi:hypothetical protein
VNVDIFRGRAHEEHAPPVGLDQGCEDVAARLRDGLPRSRERLASGARSLGGENHITRVPQVT